MQTNEPARTSGASLTDSLSRITDAGGSVVQIRTREPLRAAMVLRRFYAEENSPYHEWSASSGWRSYGLDNYTDHLMEGRPADFSEALERPRKELTDPKSAVRAASDRIHVFVYIDPGPHIASNPYVVDLINQYASSLPVRNCAVLLVTDDKPLEGLPQGLLLVTDMPTPTDGELQEILRGLLEKTTEPGPFSGGHSLTDEDIVRVAHLGLGMTYTEFETHVALSIISAEYAGSDCVTVDHLLDGLSVGKTEIVRQSEILELMPSENMDNVGGMQRLKDWISQRSDCYTQEARDFGIEPPKGMVLVGVPGAGKSLVAKSVAGTLGVPLIRLDFGRVFSKYIGDSEQRVRSALHMVEQMSPCVLFVDEVDKGLGGIGAGGDSGTTMRVLGTYLTWLQELKAPVFNIVTANRVNGLPPELLRRGRFDQIFSVSMPSPPERRDVLEIHLRKRGRNISDLRPQDVSHFVEASEGYVAAEIESVVRDALVEAYSKRQTLGIDHLMSALRQLIPMSKSHAEQIGSILEWARNNAVSVSYEPGTDPRVAEDSAASQGKNTRRVLLRPGTRK